MTKSSWLEILCGMDGDDMQETLPMTWWQWAVIFAVMGALVTFGVMG